MFITINDDNGFLGGYRTVWLVMSRSLSLASRIESLATDGVLCVKLLLPDYCKQSTVGGGCN